jgi:uncharacterized SAM-binding protein YcdF (DUF218 family)
MTFFRRKKWIIRAMIGCFALAVWIAPGLLCRPLGWILYRHDHPEKNADAILLLMGEPAVRPRAAALAVEAGYAKQIIFVTPQSSQIEDQGLMPSEEHITMQILLQKGLSRGQIFQIAQYGRATSTADEAIALSQYLDKNPGNIRRIVVVTSWPHSSRAGWILEKALQGRHITIQMQPIDQIPFHRDNWWQSERGMLFVFEEFMKYARYYAKYCGRNLAPMPETSPP